MEYGGRGQFDSKDSGRTWEVTGMEILAMVMMLRTRSMTMMILLKGPDGSLAGSFLLSMYPASILLPHKF
jgi:hypothetical protein